MGKVTPNFQELYDWLKENRPDILEWCKDQARWQRCPIGAIITWKEDAIRRMMAKPQPHNPNDWTTPHLGVR